MMAAPVSDSAFARAFERGEIRARGFSSRLTHPARPRLSRRDRLGGRGDRPHGRRAAACCRGRRPRAEEVSPHADRVLDAHGRAAPGQGAAARVLLRRPAGERRRAPSNGSSQTFSRYHPRPADATRTAPTDSLDSPRDASCRLYLADLGDSALSQGEAHILAELAAGAPATISSLHRGLAHKRSTLTSILDRLVDRGLITRKTGTADRRTFSGQSHGAGTDSSASRPPTPADARAERGRAMRRPGTADLRPGPRRRRRRSARRRAPTRGMKIVGTCFFHSPS